ncbi:MAG: shikimate dehydrogenase [Pseudomonadota bacterium]
MSDELGLPFAEVIGDPIAQSKSPAIHAFWLERLGIEARYEPRQVNPDNLKRYIANRREDSNWRGCNITMPLKELAIDSVDRVEPHARKIGAINTVYRGGEGELVGTNTDVEGFLEPLQKVLDQKHLFRMARIIGTGGAARAIIAALGDHGFTLVVAGRNPAKARKLVDELAPDGEHYIAPLGHFGQPTDFRFDDREDCLDLVVNASPLGMRGSPPLAFDWSHAPPGSIAYDIVTDPKYTAFLHNAEANGFEIIDGLSMLIGQAATAFERFFGQKPPRQHDAELQAILTR